MGLIKYLMGTDARRSLRKLNKMTDKVEELEPKYQAMDDAELKSQTGVLKERLANGETLDFVQSVRELLPAVLIVSAVEIVDGDGGAPLRIRQRRLPPGLRFATDNPDRPELFQLSLIPAVEQAIVGADVF